MLENRKVVYWHIGLAKTGTTSLQTHVFPNIDNINYLGRFYGKESKYIKEKLHNYLVWDDWLIDNNNGFDLSLETLRKNNLVVDVKNDFLISHEGITSSVLFPQVRGKIMKFNLLSESIEKLCLISEIANLQPKIILVLRRQDDYLSGLYAEGYSSYKRDLGIKNIDDFINFLFQEHEETGVLNNVLFSKIENLLKLKFGEKSVCILPYELLKLNPTQFLSILGDFIGRNLNTFNDSLAVRRENTRSSSNGRLMNRTPLSIQLKRSIGARNIKLHGLGRVFNYVFEKNKYQNMSKESEIKIEKFVSRDNKILVGNNNLFKSLNYPGTRNV